RLIKDIGASTFVSGILRDAHIQVARQLHVEARVLLSKHAYQEALVRVDAALAALVQPVERLDFAEFMLTRARILKELHVYMESSKCYLISILYFLGESDAG